jgi:rhomboid protease GluP
MGDQISAGTTAGRAPRDGIVTVPIRFFAPKTWSALAKPLGHWKWVGRGKATVTAELLRVDGLRHRTLLPSVPQSLCWPRAQIRDVLQTGTHVRLQVGGSAQRPEILQFWTDGDDAAAALVRELPTEQSTTFANARAEAEDFAARLEQLPPRRYVTEALVAANCLMFIVTVLAGVGLMAEHSEVLVHWGSNLAVRTLHGEWWRLLTSMFLHFGVFHLALNMLALWSSGRLAERLYGSGRFLLLYVASGMTGSMASVWWNPGIHSVGASGAIFGIIGGLLAFMADPRTRIPTSIARAQLSSLAVFVAYNLLNGVSHRGIDNAAHLGGLAGGFVIGWLLSRPLTAEAHNIRAHPHGVALALLGVLTGLALWIARHHPLTGDERAFQYLLRATVSVDSDLLSRTNGIRERVSKRVLSESAAGRMLAGEITEAWRDQRDIVMDARLAKNSQFEPLRAALVEYLDSRRLESELTGEALITHKPEQQQWAADVAANAQRRQQVVKRLVPLYME